MGCDAAHVVFIPSNLDVACIAPGCPPAVLHQPVFRPRGFVNSVANNENGVVVVDTAAFCFPVHSSSVEVERLMVGINWYEVRLLLNNELVEPGWRWQSSRSTRCLLAGPRSQRLRRPYSLGCTGICCFWPRMGTSSQCRCPCCPWCTGRQW